MANNITQIQGVNSTTYADTVGIQIGLPRLPNETATQYIKRLEAAVRLRRDAPYEGVLNEINLQLGFEPANYISITSADTTTVVSVSIAGVLLTGSSISSLIPLLNFGLDNVWEFRMLSDVVKDINNLNAGYVATLLVPDGPAIQLCRQTNSLWSFSEPITGIHTQLLHTGIQVGSELFSGVVPSYTLNDNGLLIFSSAPDSAAMITYNYHVWPYSLVGAPTALIGFTDPEFPAVAATPNSVLAYQVREFIQTIMLEDRSYWAR